MMAYVSLRILGLLVPVVFAGNVLQAIAMPAEDTYIVVSTQSMVHSITRAELLAIYTGRQRSMTSGVNVTPLDQRRDGAARAYFYQSLTGMDIARINSYWARLRFTGQVFPPRVVGDDSEMLQQLRADPTAVGYTTHEPQDLAVRVLLKLP